MKIAPDTKSDCLVINDDIEVYTCDETGKVLNMYSRTGAEIDSDEIEEEVFNYRTAQNELETFGSLMWSATDKEWTL